MCVCVYVCVCVVACLYMYVYIRVCVCMCLVYVRLFCMYVYLCVCVCVCVCVYAYVRGGNRVAVSKASLAKKAMSQLRASLAEEGVRFRVQHHEHLHDREVQLDRKWLFRLGRGLDIYQPPTAPFAVGALDFALRPCLETSVSVYGIVSKP
jgi:Phospholipase D-like domain at C-terminus of MIT